MDPRRGRPSLAERGVIPRMPAAAAPSQPVPAEAPGRHCWVTAAPGLPGRWRGLLVEWRRGVSGWEGLVLFVVPAGADVGLRQEWLAASCLEVVATT
jgi:hypothetical protein